MAEESLSAPIFVTIVQRNEEADYYTNKYPPYPPPPPKYPHEPEYYPPPPPPPKYHHKPEYHPLPIPTYPPPPPPPPIYHPVPDYHPPPPPKYHHDNQYHHFQVQAKYYHGSDYNEPSYHKPKFFDESLYHHDIEYHPPSPPPLPLPKHKIDHPSHPPVYHPKIHHEPKHQHSYLPPTPPPPRNFHKPDYYKEPGYQHHEVQYSAPTKYEYHLDIYDRKDNYEPHYYDHPKLPTNHQVLQPKPYQNLKEPIEEVKHEYRKGSRSFEHSISHHTAVHVDGDNLYRDAPPHGFIKAKYEPSTIYHPEPHYSPLRSTTSSYQRYNEAPLPLPLQPPASHHDIKSDHSPKTKHLLSLPLSSPQPFHDVPLPAPLPSLEDVDPLIFEPIFSYNDYFDEATKIPVGDFSISVSSLLLPRDSPFDFYLNQENTYSSQLPKKIIAFTNPPSSSILPTYKSPTFTAEEEEEEYYQNGLTYTLLTSAKPPLLPTTYSDLPVTYNASAVLATPSRAPEVPVASSLLTSMASESPAVSKEIAKSTTVTPVVHAFQELKIQEPTNDSMINLTVSETLDSLTVMTQPTLTTPRLKLILPPTDLTVTPTAITALSRTDSLIMSENFIADDSSKMTQDAILFTDVLTDTSVELVDTSADSPTTQVFIADPKLRLQSTEPTLTPVAITALPQTDDSVLAESLVTDNSFEMTDDKVLLATGPDTTKEPSTMQGFLTETTSTRPILKQKLHKNKVTNKVNQTSTLTMNQLAATQSGQSRRDFLELFYPNRNPTLSISLFSPNAISPNDRNKLAQFFLSNKKVSDSNASTVFITEKEENLKSLTNNSSEKQQKSPDQSKKRLRVKQSSKQEKNLTIMQFHSELHSYPIAEDGFKPVLIPSELITTNKTSQTTTTNTYSSKSQSQTLPVSIYSTKQSPSGTYGSKSSSSSSISSMYESKPTGYRSPVSIFGPSKSSKWLVTTQQEKILSLQRNSKTRVSSQVTDKNNWNLPMYFQL